MNAAMLALLTPNERAALGRLTLDRATYATENGADDPTCASCGVPVSVRDGCDFEPGEDVCDSCAHLRNATNAANLRAALATIAALRARLTTGIGLPLGVNDRDGNPVHVGDTLAFQGSVWSRGVKDPPDHFFVVSFERGQVRIDGTIGDIEVYCRIVKRWDGSEVAQ